MSDLEWYLDVSGKQSGPHSAKEIVEQVRAGKISASSQVTAARMGGDWVTAQDLVDAYDELYAKKPKNPATPAPIDSNFAAPPRPTEQLEKSKIFTINREELDRTPDPTEALFQAIQAIREKANQKSAPTPLSPAHSRETFGQQSRENRITIPPQLFLILTLASIFGVTIYGIVKIIRSKKTDEVTSSRPASMKSEEKNTAAPRTNPDPEKGGGLISTHGTGESAARTTPPVQPRALTNRVKPNHPSVEENLNKTGGARYRDENDPILENPPENNNPDPSLERNPENPDSAPVDPSQVPSERIIPEPGSLSPHPPLPDGVQQ